MTGVRRDKIISKEIISNVDVNKEDKKKKSALNTEPDKNASG